MIKTLLVDDDRTSLLLLSKFIEDYCDCTKCSSVEEAVEAIRESLHTGQPFGLMFIDIQVDDADGRKLLKVIRDIESKQSVSDKDRCKIVMVTGERDVQIRKECIDLGANAYVMKPIDHFIIKSKLKTLGLIE